MKKKTIFTFLRRLNFYFTIACASLSFNLDFAIELRKEMKRLGL